MGAFRHLEGLRRWFAKILPNQCRLYVSSCFWKLVSRSNY
jgi:hypothetical protein